jgi:hypothetical protein
MNTLSRQPQLALGDPSERLRDFRNGPRIDDVNVPLSAVSDEAWASDRRRVGIVDNPETAGVSGEPAQILDRFLPSRFESLNWYIMAPLKHAPRYSFTRKPGAFQRDVDEAKKSAVGENMFDKGTLLARAQNAFNTQSYTASKAGFQLALHQLGSLHEAPLQFTRRGVMETGASRSTQSLKRDLVRVEKSHVSKQSPKTRLARESCFSSSIRTANDPEFRISHKAAGYELACFNARVFASANAVMSSEVNSSDSGSIGCCRSIKKRTKSSASCCKRGGSFLAPSKICSATLIVKCYHYCRAVSSLFQYPVREISYFHL